MHVHGAFGAGVDYTVRLTVKMANAVEESLLRAALEKTQQRYPYLSLRLEKNEREFYYRENPLPIALLRRDGRISLNTAETNFHLWAVCFWEDCIHLDVFHGLMDGAGMYRVLATLLYYYCAQRYGVTEHKGILTLDDPIDWEEIADPQDALARLKPQQSSAAPLSPAFTLETDGGLTPSEPSIWDVELPEDAFLRYTTALDSSPGTLVSLLFARTIDSLYPKREKDIVSAYVINARPMLRAERTHHNCLDMAIFPYSDRVRAMPLTRQCTVYRGMTFVQSDAARVRADMTANAAQILRVERSAAGLAERKALYGQMFRGGEGLLSFLVSYTGKWPYPAVGNSIREFWTHPPNTFSLMAEIGAVNGKLFLSIQQRFREDLVRKAFLQQLEELQIPHTLIRVMGSDVAHFPEP